MTLHYHFQGAKLKAYLDNNKKLVSKWVLIKRFFGVGRGRGAWRTRTRLKMRTRRAVFLSKVRDNSAPKMILGACWGAYALARHSSPSLINSTHFAGTNFCNLQKFWISQVLNFTILNLIYISKVKHFARRKKIQLSTYIIMTIFCH